jgi:dipeptidase
MCDTFVVLPESTKDGSVIFGKNSDREPNEAQEVVMLPAVDHQAEERLHCSYIDIPQVEHTHGVLLLKPFWMWGAEMGANEHGVVIGNEAVFTRLPVEKTDALTGMDLIRLGLERSLTAGEALETIITLIEKYGQGGNGGLTHPFYYHNSFIIADQREAWVLEVAGKEWAVEKASGVRSISNAITIGSTWDRASGGLVDTAVRRGWCKSKEDFDFGRCYSEPVLTTFGAGKYRQACTTGLLNFRKGQIGVDDAFSVLRAHSLEAKDSWRPDTALTGAEVCMHVGFGPVRISQSVGSFVAHLTPDRHTYWVTGTSAPCTSLFKPLWFEGGIPWSAELAPTGTYDPACLWWRHEKLHRRIIHDFPPALAELREDQQKLERCFLDESSKGGNLGDVSVDCFARAEELERRWQEEFNLPSRKRSRYYYRLAWNKFNRQADFKPDVI